MRKAFAQTAVTVCSVAAVLAGCAGQPSAPAATPPNAQANVFSTYLSARFAARVTLERRLGLAEARYALALAEALPESPDSIAELLRRIIGDRH